MHSLREVGYEWHYWLIKHILETEVEAVNLREAFEDLVRECYLEETKVDWTAFDTATLMNKNDPVSGRCAQSEYVPPLSIAAVSNECCHSWL